MTSQEAWQQISECEKKIKDNYSNLCNAANSMGTNVHDAALATTEKSTLLPLIISLAGLVLCFASHPFWGVILIIAGIVCAYYTHDSAASTQKAVDAQVEALRRVLNENSKI